ncbi:MAG: nucleotidyltransferase domain-containing protein [Bacteroidota bacterium]
MKKRIYPHHQYGIDNLVRTYKNNPQFQGIIIGGSIAKGLARPDSDVDFMIIVTDEEYQKRAQQGDLFINRKDLTNYPNGFVDGKIINLAYLTEVAKKGNEPTRAAFDGAFIGYSRIEGLEQLMEAISTYPESSRTEKLRTFYSMSFIQNWLMGEAQRHDNLYTRSRAASQLVLFAGRLILAYNRLFFPYHKWFYAYLDKCLEKPAGLIEQMNTLLETPNAQHAETLFESVKAFHDWGVTDLEAFSWFMQDVEWAWMRDQASLEDW